MTPPANDAATRSPVVRLEQLVGRRVLAANNRSIGRLEDVRAELQDGRCTITEYVIGVAGLFERLGLGVTLLLGGRVSGYIARWDQLDISDPERPRLTCPLADLRAL
jgi:hypothetical protein